MSGPSRDNTGLAGVFGQASAEAESFRAQKKKVTPLSSDQRDKKLSPAKEPTPDRQSAPVIQSKKKPSPFCLRLTEAERAYLEQKAGVRPLGTYIRARLLEGHAEKRRPVRKPKVDDKQIALVLAELGRSRLSSNLNQLAKAVHCGTLDVSAKVEEELKEACQAVVTMRDNLIAALGLKVEESL